jgi:hypothetical protein
MPTDTLNATIAADLLDAEVADFGSLAPLQH